jgi:hypothetical protein
MTQTAQRSKNHRRVLIALVLLVTLVHLWLTREVADRMQEASPDASSIQRMEATYVSELKLSEPPRAPATPAAVETAAASPRKARRKAVPPKAASQPEDAASQVAQAASKASEPEAAVVAETPASGADSAQAAAPPPVAAASGAASGPTFVWPEATRVTYKIEGFFRGPIYGQASVEWVRKDDRYQVHVNASVGPSFAPLGSWRLTSEGLITPAGLAPQRYENVNRLLIKTMAPRKIVFEDKEVILANGERVPRDEGVQDPASQFIQLAYSFILKPERLQVGKTIRLPLAILTRAETLAYDVLAEEVLDTPIGKVPTFHVKPRRLVEVNANLPADIWFAPGLQYLPVRIFVKVNEETYMDMLMDKAPQQAPGKPADPAPGSASAP